MGILYWKNRYNGSVIPVDIHLVLEGHCSEIGARNYKCAHNHVTAWRDLGSELDANYDLDSVAAKLDISHLL